MDSVLVLLAAAAAAGCRAADASRSASAHPPVTRTPTSGSETGTEDDTDTAFALALPKPLSSPNALALEVRDTLRSDVGSAGAEEDAAAPLGALTPPEGGPALPTDEPQEVGGVDRPSVLFRFCNTARGASTPPGCSPPSPALTPPEGGPAEEDAVDLALPEGILFGVGGGVSPRP